MADSFKLWLEFEQWEPEDDDDPEDEFFNMHVELEDGRMYALDVWTFGHLGKARYVQEGENDELVGSYRIPPDLLVARCDRPLLEDIVRDIIVSGGLLDEWLIEE